MKVSLSSAASSWSFGCRGASASAATTQTPMTTHLERRPAANAETRASVRISSGTQVPWAPGRS